jgi:hypothetical protein
MGLRSFFKKVSADSLHTNEIAKAQPGAKFGAVSTESFTKRQEINKNRQHIGVYKQAQVVGGYRKEAMVGRADSGQSESDMPLDDGRPHPRRAANRISRIDIVRSSRRDQLGRNSTQTAPARPAAAPAVRFREPDSRKYNPYG